MAKLTECAAGYREAAVRLRLAIADRQRRAQQGDREAQRQLALLRQMLQQMRELRELGIRRGGGGRAAGYGRG